MSLFLQEGSHLKADISNPVLTYFFWFPFVINQPMSVALCLVRAPLFFVDHAGSSVQGGGGRRLGHSF